MFSLFFFILAIILIFLAGVAVGDGDGEGFILFIPAAVLIFIAALAAVGDHNDRWSDWSVCEDGKTRVEAVVIADCDDYYKYPGEPKDD